METFEELVANIINEDEKLKKVLQKKIRSAVETIDTEQIIVDGLTNAISNTLDDSDLIPDLIDNSVKKFLKAKLSKLLKE